MAISRKVKFAVLMAPVPVVALVVAGYASLVYVPGWYRPEAVTADEQQVLTDELTKLAETLHNGMQHPQPFVFRLTQRQANRLIAGRALIDPQLAEALPEQLADPAVAWRDGRLYVGAVVQYRGMKLLASVGLAVSVDEHFVHVNDLNARIGAWPAPLSRIEAYLQDRGAGSSPLSDEVIEDLVSERRVANRFSYPNSDYDFRIENIVAANGELAVTIVPIDPVR